MDRNTCVGVGDAHLGMSLSARRAWIEIIYQQAKVGPNMSLSARRAWIEIVM